MKKVITGTLAMLAVTAGLFAFKSADAGKVVADSAVVTTAAQKSADSLRITVEAGVITGKVTPADGATEVEATIGETTLKATVADGAFTLKEAQAGTYTVVVKGKAPYKNATFKDVKVEDGKSTDLGEIKLEQ